MTEFLTTEEAAELLRLEPHTLLNKVRRGVLRQGVHYYRRPGEIGIRFDKEALIRWVKEGDKPKRDGIPMARGYNTGG